MEKTKIMTAFNSLFSISVLRPIFRSRGLIEIKIAGLKRGADEWI